MEAIALFGLIILVFIYILPAVIANNRNVKNQGLILLVNVLLGWTLLGWVLVFIWAIVEKEDPALVTEPKAAPEPAAAAPEPAYQWADPAEADRLAERFGASPDYVRDNPGTYVGVARPGAIIQA